MQHANDTISGLEPVRRSDNSAIGTTATSVIPEPTDAVPLPDEIRSRSSANGSITAPVDRQLAPENKDEGREQQPGQAKHVDNDVIGEGLVPAGQHAASSVRVQMVETTSESSSGTLKARPQTHSLQPPATAPSPTATRSNSVANPSGVSEHSHQQLAPRAETDEIPDVEEDLWQDMPAFATHDVYDDDGRLVARAALEEEDENTPYTNLGGAAKGYTRVQVDEDAQSATSMDENTAYLFKEKLPDEDEEFEEQRDPVAQMQAMKSLLTDNQKVAYVGVVRLAIAEMVKDQRALEGVRGARKDVEITVDSLKMWSQKMMVRLYGHIELDAAEQIMIEQLAEHGLQPQDLTPTLMQNARVKNPIADGTFKTSLDEHSRSSTPTLNGVKQSAVISTESLQSAAAAPPPPYEEHKSEDMPAASTPSQLPHTSKIDIDIRWTILCDLFLILISDSVYDARSRTLLERVGTFLDVPWLDICRFEKRVTEALEMQEAANKENWDEQAHLESRKKRARNRRLVMMGLATVGGGIVIGLSAGLLAPVIGAGLAAGFTTIGVTGTGSFLAGAGGAAVIGTTGALTGGTVGVRAAKRRVGAVRTFEYRPLHNNKRVNLVVTVAGWMTGKVDDVRLPFSTVDPIMGDIYSVLWEPEMLRSMGDTINILATEALTSGLQQVLGSTILVALMSAIQLPVVLTKLSYLIDNPWSVSLARADLAGLILADSLIDRNLGARPITLIGFSLGSRVIFSCLRELGKRGATGLVQNAYLFGSPIVAKKDEYTRARAVVSGRFVNGYATNDWILGYLFRATSGGIMRVAGLAEVTVPGVENVEVTQLVPGHMAYRAAMPKLMRLMGWAVESDEFAEIEDPDPDNHDKRQRELINEIEEARKEQQKKPAKKRFNLFRSKKATERKEWETYEESKPRTELEDSPEAMATVAGGTLFDIDAIRREAVELAAQGVEVKQLETTLPMLRTKAARSDPSEAVLAHRPHLTDRGTRSFDASSVPHGAYRNGASSKSLDYDEYDDHETPGEGNVSLSFETAYKEPIHPPSPLNITGDMPSRRDSPEPQWSPGPSTAKQRKPLGGMSPPASQEEPPSKHNVWADDDDELGHEKELKATINTHDLYIAGGPPAQTTGAEARRRSLHAILLTPSDIADDDGSPSQLLVLRLERFASLTDSAKTLVYLAARLPSRDASSPSPSPSPARTLMLLHALVLTQPTLRHLPVLPIARSALLVPTIADYRDVLLLSTSPSASRELQPAEAARRSITTLLPHATAAARPMDEHTVYVLSDEFSGLADLAGAAVGGTQDEGRIRDCLLGSHGGGVTSADVADFWREEWVVE